MIRVKSQQNVAAGLFFTACGVLETALASRYDFGEPAAMGPGFMPVIFGIALACLGIGILLGGLIVEGPPIERGHWRPFVCIIGALLLFALLINKAGLALSVFVVVMLGGMAYRARVPWLRLLLLAVVLSGLAVALFVYALGQPIAAWGSA